ncbi:syntaxin-16 [Toxorhynchites rutilus septentrionalis]|uniref:syntaxin-16 n=1 Tax=Toxorhynchites rutilus septentrionalis TaxID=329112 RepID=UPI00247ACDE2|nr:syntaxin-16 [Toxorhynchites rutilus septentrionalis]XP_055639614.1 syntaxin-16 [Toxorhynchites rutilus septentrionalis]
MSQRNLTELFFMLRNNVLYSKNIYSESRNADNVALLDKRIPGGLDATLQPNWIGKYDEIHYLLSKIKTRIDDLLQIQDTTAWSVLSENRDNELRVQNYAKDISKQITNCHSHIKCIKSCAKNQNRLECILLQNIEKYLLMALQKETEKFQQSQMIYNSDHNNIEEKSKALFENISTNIDTIGNNSVDTFDNFLNMNVESSPRNQYENDDDRLDEYFQLPATGMSINQKQLMLIEADNTKMIQSREHEVSKIVSSIVDLNVIFKDLSQLVQEQGTILDRIDYNIESTQTKIIDGYKQLQKAEKYQRKNKKIYCILILAVMVMFMIILTIFKIL